MKECGEEGVTRKCDITHFGKRTFQTSRSNFEVIMNFQEFVGISFKSEGWNNFHGFFFSPCVGISDTR